VLVRGSAGGRRYHLQVTAAAADTPNSEANDVANGAGPRFAWNLLASQQFEKVTITFRGIGEMMGTRTPATRMR